MDFDGDCVEVMFMSPRQSSLFEKYNPAKLMKGHTDISLKKSTKREKSTGQLANDQKDLKLYTSISGAIAIELCERSRTCKYGHTQVSELYHFMAQTALNLKHRRDGIDLIQKLSGHFLSSRKGELSVSEFRDILKGLKPSFKEKDLRRLCGLLRSSPAKSLNFVRNNVNPSFVAQLAGSAKLSVEEEIELASHQFVV